MESKFVVLLLVFFLLFSACSKTQTKAENTKTIDDQSEQLVQTNVTEQTVKVSPAKVDYDLSNLNYNMLSSITFEMLIEPEKYINKTVKISGQFYSEVEDDIRYYSAITWDSTLCCPAGMDFIPPSTMTYPEDFPAPESKITVTGKLVENPADGNLLFYADTVEF